MPKSNTDFWKAKFERNVERDSRVAKALAAMGWHVFVAWECELQSKARIQITAERIAREISAEAIR